MRVRKSTAMVAAVVSVAGLTAPTAYAFDNRAPSAGAAPPALRVQDHRASSTDWLLIGVGGAGAITLAGAGAGARARVGARRRARHGATTRGERLRPASGS